MPNSAHGVRSANTGAVFGVVDDQYKIIQNVTDL
jgi:hypothetical protein